MECLYKRIFSYGSLQFCGHFEEYLAAHTEDLLVYIVQPRVGATHNLLRRYRKGSLIDERPVRSSQNIFLYYALWFFNHVRFLLSFCPRHQPTIVFGGHPVVFFGMRFFRLLRPLRYAYWVGDYFPSRRPVIRAFEWLKRRYLRRVDFAYYLTDAINRVMNGGMLADTPSRRTVMWGLKPYPRGPVPPPEPFTLLMVGLIRPGQGIERLFAFLRERPAYRLAVIGVCQPAYFEELQRLLDESGLRARVQMPNRFYSEEELLAVARTAHVGLALYDTSAENFTHYADPGKVKAYAEMRLPILMTRISDIVPYVERFGCGEVIDRYEDLGAALDRIRVRYADYQQGIERFLEYFEFERYYREAFRMMEGSWMRRDHGGRR